MFEYIAVNHEMANENKPTSICAISVVHYKGGEIQSEKSWLIKPPSSIKFTRSATYQHGLEYNDVCNKPDFSQVWPEIRNHLHNKTLVAYYGNYFVTCLARTFKFYFMNKKKFPDLHELNMPYAKFVYFDGFALPCRIFSNLYINKLEEYCNELGYNINTKDSLSVARACGFLTNTVINMSGAKDFLELKHKLEISLGEVWGSQISVRATKVKMNPNNLTSVLDEDVQYIEDNNDNFEWEFTLPEYTPCIRRPTEERLMIHLPSIDFKIVAKSIKENDYNLEEQLDSVTPSPNTKRIHKGSSVLELVKKYVVVDIETTGLDPDFDTIIEIAAVRVDNGIIINTFQSLIKPIHEVRDFITELTGITNEMLSTAPIMSSVLPKFVEFVDRDVIVGHNVNFDINFIYDNCMIEMRKPFTNDFIDTMRLGRKVFPELSHHRLIDIVERCGINESVEHRALSDAIKTHKCYEYIMRFITDNKITFNYRHLQNLSAKDIRTANTCFNEDSLIFGKVFVFTGVLERMLRKDAMQLVVDNGGICADRVTKKTSYLVLGNNEYNASIKDGKSTKYKEAERLRLSGVEIEIISENVFYEMVDDSGQSNASEILAKVIP